MARKQKKELTPVQATAAIVPAEKGEPFAIALAESELPTEPDPIPDPTTLRVQTRAKMEAAFLAKLSASWACDTCSSTKQPEWKPKPGSRRIRFEGRCPDCGEDWMPHMTAPGLADVHHADGLLIIQRKTDGRTVTMEAHFALSAIAAIVWEPDCDRDHLRIVLLAGESWCYDVTDAKLAMEAFAAQARSLAIGLGDFSDARRTP